MARTLHELVNDLLVVTRQPELVTRYGEHRIIDIRALCAEVADRLELIDKAGRDVYEFLQPVYGVITDSGGMQMQVRVNEETERCLPVGQRVIVQPD